MDNRHDDKKIFEHWLLNAHEKSNVEFKTAKNSLPDSFWETYSSFSNTSGGIIVLGISENNPINEIVGVDNPDKVINQLWNLVSNKEKVSVRNLENWQVKVEDIGGKKVIIINVKEVSDRNKPVYINGRLENSYIRTGDGDRKVTKEELSSMFRNANPFQDSLVIENFTLKDLDEESIINFKNLVSKKYPTKNYNSLSNEDFLVEIGAAVIDRITKDFKIKKGILLFLGKCNSIKELYPSFHLDYFNKTGKNPRWTDRVSDDEPYHQEINIFNFFNIVHEKLRLLLKNSFQLDGSGLRINNSDLDETVREGLVNCLVHADYEQGYPSIKVEAYDGCLIFTNPGKMLISTQQYFSGGDSRPRNEILMKLFRLLGAAERQGFGGKLIYQAAIKNDLKRPELVTDVEKTSLKIWSVDLADSYPELNQSEKLVLKCISKASAPLSVNELKMKISFSDYMIRKCISGLVSKKLIEKTNSGPNTKYYLKHDSIEMFTKLEIMINDLKILKF